MLSRALRLARREFLFLEGVSVDAEGDFHGLEESLHDVEAGEAAKGLLSVLITLIDLLVGFIGEELTLRLVGEVWPEPLVRSIQPGTSEGHEAAS